MESLKVAPWKFERSHLRLRRMEGQLRLRHCKQRSGHSKKVGTADVQSYALWDNQDNGMLARAKELSKTRPARVLRGNPDEAPS